MKPDEASRFVIGAALKVHSALGAGVLESACDACLYCELTEAGLQFEHQVTLPVVYRGIQLSTAFGLLLNFNVPHTRNGIHRVINGPEDELRQFRRLPLCPQCPRC